MDDTKLQNFAAEHSGKQLPIQKCSEEQVAALRARLLRQLALPDTTDGRGLVEAVASRSVPIQGQDASRSDFDLARLLIDAVGISLKDDVFLNWYRFDQLDRMRAAELAEFFDNVVPQLNLWVDFRLRQA